MGRIDVVIPDDLEMKLRSKAVTDFKGKKGSLAQAVIAAIESYVGEKK